MVHLSEDVIGAAKTAQQKWKVPASVTLAQYGLESQWGQHMPTGSDNPFGIKARPGQPFVTAMTHERVHGQIVRIEQNFRKYASIAEAFDDHGRLLATAPVYKPAMDQLPDLIAFVDLMAQHYAGDPHYAAKILDLIHSDNLSQYDT